MDIAGLDVLGHVITKPEDAALEAESAEFALPPLIDRLIERGSVGEKSGEGFYKRQKSAGGASEILTLDPATMTYRPKQSAKLSALDAAKAIDDLAERTKTLFLGKDKVGEFLRATLGPLAYICGARRTGYRLLHRRRRSCDAVGIWLGAGPVRGLGRHRRSRSAGRGRPERRARKERSPPLVADLLKQGRIGFRDGSLPPSAPGLQLLEQAKDGPPSSRRTQAPA